MRSAELMIMKFVNKLHNFVASVYRKYGWYFLINVSNLLFEIHQAIFRSGMARLRRGEWFAKIKEANQTREKAVS